MSISLKELLRKHLLDERSAPLPLPMAVSGFAYSSTTFLDLPLYTQMFGALPSGFGVSTRDGMIQVDTRALDGPIDPGFY